MESLIKPENLLATTNNKDMFGFSISIYLFIYLFKYTQIQ